jgi:hypothetical protein
VPLIPRNINKADFELSKAFQTASELVYEADAIIEEALTQKKGLF